MCGLVIRTPALSARCRKHRVAAWRSIRAPRPLSRIGPLAQVPIGRSMASPQLVAAGSGRPWCLCRTRAAPGDRVHRRNGSAELERARVGLCPRVRIIRSDVALHGANTNRPGTASCPTAFLVGRLEPRHDRSGRWTTPSAALARTYLILVRVLLARTWDDVVQRCRAARSLLAT